ncbi:MAG: patatin-like phospholipase family protein [archaeon]
MTNGTCLLMSGGGSKTAWMAGILAGLAEICGFFPDFAIAGSGSTYSTAQYIARNIRPLEIAWKEGKVADKNFINYARLPWNWVDLDYLLYEICKKQVPLNREDYLNSETNLFIAATNRDSGEIVYFEKPSPDNDRLLEICRASCAIPGLKWGGVEIDGQRYCDTHISSSGFYHKKKARELGAEKTIIVSPGKHHWLTTKLEDYWVRLRDGKFQRNYRRQEAEMRELEENIEASELIISPMTPLAIDTFSRHPVEMRNAYMQGYAEVGVNKELIDFLKM